MKKTAQPVADSGGGPTGIFDVEIVSEGLLPVGPVTEPPPGVAIVSALDIIGMLVDVPDDATDGGRVVAVATVVVVVTAEGEQVRENSKSKTFTLLEDDQVIVCAALRTVQLAGTCCISTVTEHPATTSEVALVATAL